MKINQLETPALIVDKTALNFNMNEMMRILDGSVMELRPHYKTHRCTAIAHVQIKRGAKGITCAKLSEAEDLIFSGIEDVLIANQIAAPQKLARAAYLANLCRLTLCVDDEENIRALEKAAGYAGSVINCLVEYDVGAHRCGARTPEEALRLAELVAECPHLRFEGLQAYAGQLSHEPNEAKRQIATKENEAALRGLKALIEGKGLAVKTISGASSLTTPLKAKAGLYTESQAGSYIFMDAALNAFGLPFKSSLFVLSSVMSARGDLAIVDSGIKSCGMDAGVPVCMGIEAEIKTSEEHIKIINPSQKLSVGDKVRLIPRHCCSTVNLYDYIYLAEGDYVVDRLPVTSRGRSV